MKNTTKNNVKLNDLKKMEIKNDDAKKVKGGGDIVIGDWRDI